MSVDSGTGLLSRRDPRACDVRFAVAAVVHPVRTGASQWLAEGVATFGCLWSSSDTAAREDAALDGGGVDRCCVLVHRLDLVCESGDHDRPLTVGHLCGHSSGGRARRSSQPSWPVHFLRSSSRATSLGAGRLDAATVSVQTVSTGSGQAKGHS